MSNKEKTKTFNYLFRVFKSFYLEKNVSRAINTLGSASTDDDWIHLNCYLSDNSNKLSDPKNKRFYVTCDIRNESYAKAIKEIEKSRFYRQCYVHKNCENCAVIILECPTIMHDGWEHFLNSEYSKIYENIPNLFKDRSVRSEYICYGCEMDYIPPYYILQKDEEYFEKIIGPLTDQLTDKELAEVKSKEFDSKIVIEKEIILW